MNKIIIIALSLFIVGCGTSEKNETEQGNSQVKNSSTQESTQVDNGGMQQISSLLIDNFMKDLKAELMKGVKEGGFANAINVCQVKAPEIAEIYHSDKWSIKRVTNKPRNQNNIANEHELEILALFADSLKKLEQFDEWKDPANKKDYYFYKPIYTGKLCLKCHGDSKSIDEKAAIAVKEKYPEDKAIDYKEGDLRGMFVVQLNYVESQENLSKILLEITSSVKGKK